MKYIFCCVLAGLILFTLLPGCISKTEKIRVATDTTWPPWEYVNEQTGEIEGFDIDLFKAIAEKEGLEVEFINVAFTPLLAGMAQCQYDAAISTITITEQRKKEMLFSDPYLEGGQQVTVRKNNAEITDKNSLMGKVVGAESGSTGSFEVEKIERATLKTYDDIGLAFQDLIDERIDAVIVDNGVASWYVSKNPDKLKTVGGVFTSESCGIAVCKTRPDLLEKINSGLQAVKKEGLIDKLVEKWHMR